jgi:8-oxo-dGTP pyrophosphatase MutT (NUDIX family)|tara:strand:- start:3600 stop:3989 length:390 start_codon:yes stop_codon:yes gene_type:complete
MERKNAGIIVASDTQVLLAKRNCHPGVSFPGYWSPFAGAIEGGETPEEAAIRELFEESQIKVEGGVDFLGKTSGSGGEFSLFLYKVKKIPYPVIDFEHTEWGIFRINSIGCSPEPMDSWVCSKILELNK